MKHVPDRMQDPDRPQSLDELRRRLNRRLSDLREGWKRCDKPLCRRRTQCCGEGPDFTCTGDGSPRRMRSPEERAKAISDLYKEVKRRCAERATESPQEEKPCDEPRAPTRRRRRRRVARADAATPATNSPQADGADAAPPAVEETQLAPETQARIDRAWNEYVAEQDARERRPRITQL